MSTREWGEAANSTLELTIVVEMFQYATVGAVNFQSDGHSVAVEYIKRHLVAVLRELEPVAHLSESTLIRACYEVLNQDFQGLTAYNMRCRYESPSYLTGKDARWISLVLKHQAGNIAGSYKSHHSAT